MPSPCQECCYCHWKDAPSKLEAGFPCIVENPEFFPAFSRPGKVMENHFGPGKSWKLKLKVLESPGKISLKVMHFSSGSNGKQAAIV